MAIGATAPFLHPTRACARRGDGREPALCSTTRPAITAPQLRDDFLTVGGQIMLAA